MKSRLHIGISFIIPLILLGLVSIKSYAALNNPPPDHSIDLDVDSDNDNKWYPPEEDGEEDSIEMDDPGKLIILNDDYDGNDGKPDNGDEIVNGPADRQDFAVLVLKHHNTNETVTLSVENEDFVRIFTYDEQRVVIGPKVGRSYVATNMPRELLIVEGLQARTVRLDLSCSGGKMDSVLVTPVKVDVSLDGLDETNEDKVGGFVQYHYDFPEYTNWHAGLTMESGYQFLPAYVTVTPSTLPTGFDNVLLFYDGEAEYTNAVFVLQDGFYVPAKTNYPIKELPTFYIHAHAMDGIRYFRAVHEKSRATDFVKVTNVDVDLDIDSDHSEAFGGPHKDAFEDWIEDGTHADETNKPLKFVVFNDYYNSAMNGMPGYADIALGTPTGPVEQNVLIPVEFKYPATLQNIPPEKIKVTFEYTAWDPADITFTTLANGDKEWPVSGSMRLWLKKEGRNKNKVTDSSPGDFIPAGEAMEISKLRGVTTFYLEGVNPSDTIGQDAIKATVNIAYGTTAVDMPDDIKCTVIQAALDVDTFNDSGVTEDPHEPGQGEDHYEDIEERLGKILSLNSRDKDGDGILDYLDGFDLDPDNEDDDINANEVFIPMVFTLPADIDYSNTTIRVTYDADDPKLAEAGSTGASANRIRIWTKPGAEARNKEDVSKTFDDGNGGGDDSGDGDTTGDGDTSSETTGGDYLAPGIYEAMALGFTGGVNRVVFYVEAVKLSEKKGDIRVLFEAKLDNRYTGEVFLAADAVRFTCIDSFIDITDYFSPRQAESPPYHVCKVDFRFTDYVENMCDEMELQIKSSQDSWDNLFFKTKWTPDTAVADTKLYKPASGENPKIYDETLLYGGVKTMRVCWDGRKDADGDGEIDKGSDQLKIWADRPANTKAGPVSYNARIVLRSGGDIVHISPIATTRTCPLQLDDQNLPLAGAAPYFGFYRDQVNSKYRSVMLDSPAVLTKSDGRPCVSFIPYFNGNSWDHTPMKFGWTHNYEIRMQPVYVGGTRKLYFMNEGGHLLGPVDGNGKLWIFGEQASVEEQIDSSGESTGFTLTTRVGTKYTFTGFGQIESILDRNGNTVTVKLNPYDNENLMIEYINEASGPEGKLSFVYSLQNTQLDSVIHSGGRALTFGYHDVETDVYGSPYDADEVLKTISGLEYVNEFTMGQGRRENRASRVITGSMSKRKVATFEHNFGYETEEDITTPVAEAKVNEYDVDGEWRNTTITETAATYDNDQSVEHAYNGNKLQSVKISGNGGSATYNYGYNDKGQRINASTAAGDSIMAYDDKGNLTNITTPGMASQTLEYGTLNQVSKRTLTGTGGTLEFIYELDSKGNVTKTTEKKGEENRFWNSPRNADGSVQSVTDPSPSTISAIYAYGNPLGLVQTITRSGVKLVDRTYDTFGNLISDKDAKGNGTGTILYDTLDRTKKVTHTAGPEESYEYTALDQLKSHTAPAADANTSGLTTSYSFTKTDGGKPTGRTEMGTGVNRTYAYSEVDDEGLITKMTVTEGGETCESRFTYDYMGRAVKEEWTGVTKPRWETQYDLMGNVTTSKDGEGNATLMTYYADNSVHVLTRPGNFGSVTRTIDGFGNVTSVVDDPGSTPFGAAPAATTSYQYDSFSRVKEMTDPANKVWGYTYDSLDNLKTLTTPKSKVHEYDYDARSYLKTYKQPNGKVTDVTADPNGVVEGITLPKGSGYSQPRDSFGNPLALNSPIGVGQYGSGVNNAYGMPTKNYSGGFETRIGYDSDLRVTSKAPPFAKNGKARTAEYSLYGPLKVTMMDNKSVTRDPVTDNPLARKMTVGNTRKIESVSDGNGNTRSEILKGTVSGEQDKTVAKTFDELARTVSVTAGSDVTTYTRDGRGNLIAVTAPSLLMRMTYDASDRLTKKIVTGRETTYGYDENGNCEKIDPPGPIEVKLEYDDCDRLNKRIIKLNGNEYRTETISRDDNGAITARTIKGTNNTVICSETFGRDANDRLTSFGTRTAADQAFLSYSEDSQMTEQTWAGTWTAPIGPDGLLSSVSASPAFTFDRDDEGRVTTVTRNGAIAYAYTYDDSGLLKTETDSTSTLGGPAQISHENDAYGHSMVRTLPASASLTETLTGDGKVGTSVFTFNGQTKTVSFGYNASGLLASMDLPGQAPDIGFTYNDSKELTGIAAGSACNLTLTRDADTGRVRTRGLGHLNLLETYTYHDMGRLTGESRSDGYAATYGYDEAGKRILRDISSGDFVHFTPPAASPEGTLYRVGPGFYDTIAEALDAVIADRGTAEFTSPAVIQLEPGTHAEPTVLEAQGLHTTLANPLIIQGRPGTVATLTGEVIVASAPTNMIWRGLVIGGTLSHFSVNDAAVSSCIVTGKLFFFYCENASVVGNTFKAPTAGAPLSMMFSTVLVRDNIFLVDADNGEAIEELEESAADCDYNLYWPSNTLSRIEAHGIYTNPGLDAVTFEITSTNSPAFQSGVALPGFGTDFAGVLRHPEKPCRGAVELVPDDGTMTAGDIRDKGGRLIRRRVQGRIQNLGYDGRNRLNRWDWDGSAGTSCSYDYDHAGRRILTRETVGGATKVTRYVYDGADVCAEYEDSNNDGDVDRTRVYWLLPGMDRRIGFAETVNNTTTFYYYLTDQVGTVLQIVKEDGTVVNQYDYDAFGRVRWDSENTYENGVENRYLFQGREWDKHGGFYYFRNRIYLPERGEFATPDMNLGRGILGELDGMATLTFCGGDPVNCIDPTGLIIKQEWEAKRAELISRGGWWNVVAFGSSLGEAFFDVASLGTFGKNDALVDKNLNGEISDEQLYKGIAINTGVAAASLAAGGGAAGAAGTFVATRTGSFVITGLAAGSAGGFAASSTDVLLTRAGYEGIDIPYERSVGEDVKQVVFTTVFGGGFGILGGAAARYDFYHATKVIPKTVAPANKPVVNSTSSPASAGGTTESIQDGSFSIIDWEGYPVNMPKPKGPFRILEGGEYTAARNAANQANRAMHQADTTLAGKQIHEIQPVKFGGNPVDSVNKIPLSPAEHTPATTWWNQLLRDLKRN